jgi:hypothetical protein
MPKLMLDAFPNRKNHRLDHIMNDDLSPNTAASLATEGHVYCAGSLAQCLHRWKRLSADQKATAFLKTGRDGMTPTFVRGEELQLLASNPELCGLR